MDELQKEYIKVKRQRELRQLEAIENNTPSSFYKCQCCGYLRKETEKSCVRCYGKSA